MSNLSNESVTNERLEEYLDKRMCNVTEEFRIIVRELLAYREAAGKPVAWIRYRSDGGIEGPILNEAIEECRKTAWTPLYAAPQLPAVPDELEDGCGYKDQYIDGWNACRAAMLSAAPNHTEDNLEKVNSPVIPDGWVLVPIEATPEMLNASWIHHGIHAPSSWRAMIAAAPKPGVK